MDGIDEAMAELISALRKISKILNCERAAKGDADAMKSQLRSTSSTVADLTAPAVRHNNLLVANNLTAITENQSNSRNGSIITQHHAIGIVQANSLRRNRTARRRGKRFSGASTSPSTTKDGETNFHGHHMRSASMKQVIIVQIIIKIFSLQWVYPYPGKTPLIPALF